MEKIQIKNVVSAVIVMDNSGDAERTHEISAEVTVTGGEVETFYNGRVRQLEGSEQAGSAMWHDYSSGESSLTCDGCDRSERIAIMDAIEGFCGDVRERVAGIGTVKIAE